MTVGSAAVCSVAGCSGKGDSESVAQPPLEEIILWSLLEADESISAQITVKKDGLQIFEIVHDFEGESRLRLTKDWMGDAVPYSITITLAASEETETFASSDLSNPDSIECWGLYGELGSSSMYLTSLIGDHDC